MNVKVRRLFIQIRTRHVWAVLQFTRYDQVDPQENFDKNNITITQPINVEKGCTDLSFHLSFSAVRMIIIRNAFDL